MDTIFSNCTKFMTLSRAQFSAQRNEESAYKFWTADMGVAYASAQATADALARELGGNAVTTEYKSNLPVAMYLSKKCYEKASPFQLDLAVDLMVELYQRSQRDQEKTNKLKAALAKAAAITESNVSIRYFSYQDMWSATLKASPHKVAPVLGSIKNVLVKRLDFDKTVVLVQTPLAAHALITHAEYIKAQEQEPSRIAGSLIYRLTHSPSKPQSSGAVRPVLKVPHPRG